MASFHAVEKGIHEHIQVPATTSDSPINIQLLSTSPILFTTLRDYVMHTERADLVDPEMKVTQVSHSHCSEWWCINDIIGFFIFLDAGYRPAGYKMDLPFYIKTDHYST